LRNVPLLVSRHSASRRPARMHLPVLCASAQGIALRSYANHRAHMQATTRGYSLLECIVSVGIIGMVSALAVRSTQHASSILGEFTQTLEEHSSSTKAALISSALLGASERSHLEGLIQISDGSALTLPHGGPHPVQGVGATSRPRQSSHIISAIEVEPRSRGRISLSQFDSSEIAIEVCDSASIPTRDAIKSHLLLGVAGYCQVVGTIESGTSGCFSLRGTPIRGLLLADTRCATASLHEYLAITREASLYIDTTGELRLVSHIGMRITENQPITRGLRSLGATTIRPAPGAAFFEVTFRVRANRSSKFLFPATLSQELIWNEILL